MSERFYLNRPLALGPATLDGPEAHHLAGVCRLRAGGLITLFNGDGQEYPARLVRVARRQVDLEIIDRLSPMRELAIPVELAASLPKGDRCQFLVEKLTELGVTTFVPLTCQHSVMEAGEGKMAKLRRYVIEASKQCGRNILMDVKEQVAWGPYCLQPPGPGALSILAHPRPDAGSRLAGPGAASSPSASVDAAATSASVGPVDFHQPPATGGYRLAIGPEGGFTQAEVNLAQAAGWHSIDLGPRILRLETAALALAAWVTAFGQ